MIFFLGIFQLFTVFIGVYCVLPRIRPPSGNGKVSKVVSGV